MAQTGHAFAADEADLNVPLARTVGDHRRKQKPRAVDEIAWLDGKLISMPTPASVAARPRPSMTEHVRFNEDDGMAALRFASLSSLP
jgi:hypothetical protein